MSNGLYVLQHPSSALARLPPSLHECLTQSKHTNVFSAKAYTLDMSTIWHFRLGLPSFNKMLPFKSVLHSLSSVCNNVCIVCPLEKQKRLSFPFNNYMCSSAFDLIHVDVWGPYSIPTHDGNKYFLTIVDDATRSVWAFLMKSKSEVRPLIISFHKMILTQFGVSFKALRSDNAFEFCIVDFFSANGIIHQKSYAYTLEQNFVVERKHQHILAIAKALKIQSHIPIAY